MPNLKGKELNIFISGPSVVTSPPCQRSAWWGANLWMSFYSLTWKLEREASAWSSGSFIYCLDFLAVRVLSQFCIMLVIGLEWFSGFLMPTVEWCLWKIQHLFGVCFQWTYLCISVWFSDIFCMLLFTTIQMLWKCKDSNPQELVIGILLSFCSLDEFDLPQLPLGSPVHTVLSAQPQIAKMIVPTPVTNRNYRKNNPTYDFLKGVFIHLMTLFFPLAFAFFSN